MEQRILTTHTGSLSPLTHSFSSCKLKSVGILSTRQLLIPRLRRLLKWLFVNKRIVAEFPTFASQVWGPGGATNNGEYTHGNLYGSGRLFGKR